MNTKIIIFILLIFSLFFGLFYINILLKNNSAAKISVLTNPTPRPDLPASILSAWSAYFDEPQAVASFKQHAGVIRTISPVWYQLTDTGSVTTIPNVQLKKDILETAISHQNQLIPTIVNNFNPDQVSVLLDHPDKQQQVIDYLVNESVTNGYQGYDIDWEQMYPGDKDGFTGFIESLSSTLHQKNLKLIISLQARTNTKIDNPTNQAQDWSALVKSADFIRVMAYDFHNESSPPGPVTPADNYSQTLEYSVSLVPLSKLVIGLPTYGYDWLGDKGTPLQYKEVSNILADHKSNPKREISSQALYFSYTLDKQKHEVWYEDAQSAKAKMDYARSLGIYQFCFWRLGGEDPNIWSLN